MLPDSPSDIFHLALPRCFVQDDVLYNGSDPDPLLKRLADGFENINVSRWMHGVLPATSEELSVFFKTNDGSAHVAEHPYSSASLDILAAACQKATFGQGDKDVLDETYRKAGKLDFGKFAWNKRLDDFDAMIRDVLLPFEGSGKGVRLELYKLNVYGKGSFFKSHKDTPRGDTMFGSLVLILPAPHTGGELVLKHNADELVVDAAAMLKGDPNGIAYVAFYSDVDHEVREVTEGHRVTITYNLYTFDIPGGLKSYSPVRPGFAVRDDDFMEDQLKYRRYPPRAPPYEDISIPFQVSTPSAIRSTPFHELISSLIADPTFLPQGGLLGFALQHLYPLPHPKSTTTDIYTNFSFSPQLKGVDAIVANACSSLGLKTALRIVYLNEEAILLTKTIADFGYMEYCIQFSKLVPSKKDLVDAQQWTDNKVAISFMPKWYEETGQYGEYLKYVKPVHWISMPASTMQHQQFVMRYGNDAELDHIYSHFALIVGVGPAGNRNEYGSIPPKLDEQEEIELQKWQKKKEERLRKEKEELEELQKKRFQERVEQAKKWQEQKQQEQQKKKQQEQQGESLVAE